MTELQRQYRMASRFASYLRSEDMTVESFADSVLAWLRKPSQKHMEPYACFIRVSLKLGKNGRNANVEKWTNIFPRIEKFLDIVNEKGSLFAKMIINETVAHRYADYFIQKRIFADKMKKCYIKAYKLAIEGEYWKNVDSAIYWLAVAYEKSNEFKLARKYYCKVSSRVGKRFKQRLHMTKIEKAKKKCKEFSKLGY